jgi:hypothetical protein
MNCQEIPKGQSAMKYSETQATLDTIKR